MYLMCRLCLTDEGSVEQIFKADKSLLETINKILPFEVRICFTNNKNSEKDSLYIRI